ncbi:MAG: FG-GAP-like repeat-containing protein [candidate division WOR-3 bacterium]
MNMLIILLLAQYQWIETTQNDFKDGIYEKNLFASRRNNGCVEYLPRFDLDNNGYVDLFIAARLNECHYIYWGESTGYNTGNYTIYPTSGTAGNCDAADVDFDGYPDFLVVPLQNECIFVFHGTPSGPNPSGPITLSVPSAWNESGMFADFNKDGYIDIVIGNRYTNQASIFWGSASGYSNSNSTELPTQSGQHNVEVADFNKDNWLDILFVNDNATYNFIYWGSVSGYSPSNYQTLNNVGIGHGSSVADLNSDGYLDLVFTTRNTNAACIYYGSPSGYSNYVVVNPGQGNGSGYGGSSVADLNGDGYLDIVFFAVGNPVIYWGSGSGYSDSNRFMIPIQVWTSAGFVCDLNGDGYLDILLGNWGWDGITHIVWGPNFTTSQSLAADYDHHGMFREIGNVYNRKYYEDYISSVFDAGEEVAWGIVDWDDSLPPGSSISFFVRSGNTPNPNNSWSGWDSLGKGEDIPDSLNSRYLQYRARLKYTNPAYLPYLYEVRIGYGPAVRLILEPNQADSTLPSVRIDYPIRVINIGIGLDTVDLVYQHTTNWQIDLFDSTGNNPLVDHNNNSIPDVIININDTVPIVLGVTPPSNAQGGEVDSLRLIGNSNINPALMDTVFITTKIRRVVAILVEPDQVGYTVAGVPKSYDLWVYNQGTNRDTVDLYYNHNRPWGVVLLDSLGMPLADHNNNGLVDLWVNNSDSVRFRLFIYSPDTASAGVADTLILTGRSSLNPAITDNARIITIIEGMGAIIIFPDQQLTGLPGNWVDFPLFCRNNQTFIDTIDLRYVDRLGYSYQLLDSLNNQLVDHNNNGLVDLPGIGGSGAQVGFSLRVLIPANTPSGVRDTIIVYGYSGRDTLIRDSSICVLIAGTIAQVDIEPSRSDSAYSGDSVDYLLWVSNFGNAVDVIDLRVIGADFSYILRDLSGNLLTDTDGDGVVDLGSMSGFGGCESLLVRVRIPQTNPDVVDTVIVRACSSNNISVYDDVVIVTKSLGGVWGLVIEPDHTNQVEVGKSVTYPLRAILQASLSDYVNIIGGGVMSGWQVEILDKDGSALADNNQDGIIDLNLVSPGIPRDFAVRVSAPDRFDFSGVLDTLIYFDLVVYGVCSRNEGIRDSALIRTILVPPFEVHNFRNPFRERTQFMFSLPKSGRVNLEVYTRAGELVRRLITNRHYDFGIHYYPWDGKNDSGQRLAPGVYIYVFDFYADDGEHKTVKKKAVIIK